MTRANILLITTEYFQRDAIGRRTPNLRRLAVDPGLEAATAEMPGKLLDTRIALTQYTHEKERIRLQRFRRPRS